MPDVFTNIKAGNLAAVKAEITYVNVHEKSSDGITFIMWAASWGQTEILTYLLDIGGDPNVVFETSGETALIMAAEGGHLACVQVLCSAPIESGHIRASIDFQDKLNGFTALHAAVQKQRVAVVEYLLQQRANPYLATYRSNSTPMSSAITFNNVAIVKLLFPYYGQDLVRTYPKLLLATIKSGKVEIAQYFIELQLFDLNTQTQFDNSEYLYYPIDFCIDGDYVSLFESMHKAGADLYQNNVMGINNVLLNSFVFNASRILQYCLENMKEVEKLIRHVAETSLNIIEISIVKFTDHSRRKIKNFHMYQEMIPVAIEKSLTFLHNEKLMSDTEFKSKATRAIRAYLLYGQTDKADALVRKIYALDGFISSSVATAIVTSKQGDENVTIASVEDSKNSLKKK